MKRFFLSIGITIALFCLCINVSAQGNQTVANGAATAPVNLPGGACVYKWTNDKPGIGLPASGVGNIASFTAVNTGTSPVTATITATPVPNGFAYVPVIGGNFVSVISTATDKWVATIPVGNGPVSSVVSPDGSRAYIVDSVSRDVQIINTATNKVIKIIPVGKSPFNEVISADGKWLYVVNTGDKNIAVINTATAVVTANIPLTASPYDIAISPDGTRLYVTYSNAKTAITVINTVTQKIITDIAGELYSNILEIAVSPDGSKVYATDNGSLMVYVIDASTNTVIKTFNADNYPVGLVFSPDGSRLYVGVSGNKKNILVVNTVTNTVIDSIDTRALALDTTDIVNPRADGMAFTPDGTKLITTALVYSEVIIINMATKAIEANITMGNPTPFHNFVTGAVSCGNQPITFTITVTPTASPPTVITTGAITGRMLVCANNDANSTHIQQFTANGANLTAPITLMAPAGFEVSVNAGSGYATTITIPAAGGMVNSIVYVRAAASATPGDIAGNVTLSSAGAVTQQVAVNGAVIPLPELKVVPNQTVINGDTSTTVKFPNTANIVTWTNDTPGIGLAASGAGNIKSFTAVNTSSKPIIATITATPVPAAIAYVANNKSGTVSVINTSTNTVIDSIAVGENPISVVVSPDGSRAYSVGFGSVSVIDTHNNSVIATIPVFYWGTQSAIVSPDGNWLYVGIGGSASIEEITIINTATNTVTGNIPVTDEPNSIVISPNGNTIYATLPFTNKVAIINTQTKQQTGSITVGKQPLAIALSPDGSRLYVANTIDGTVSVINTQNNLVIGTIKVDQDPRGLTISPDGSHLYVSNTGFGYYGGASYPATVSVVNTASNTVIATIPGGTSPQGISITPDGSEVLVVNSGYVPYLSSIPAGTVSVINTTTNTVTNALTVGTYPAGGGNFISPGLGCSGAPVTFTITVNPSPKITVGAVTGNIIACEGTESASPNIQQFTVSGINLAGDITVVVPPGGGFEVSLSAGTGYGNSVKLGAVDSIVTGTVIYVRSTATASAGNLTGNLVLTSPGAASQNVAVNGTVTAIVVPAINIQASANSICTGTPVTFTASATGGGGTPVYRWLVNNIVAATNSATFNSASLVNGDVVTCVLTSNALCAVPASAISNSISMTVFPEVNPEVTIAASGNNICAGTPVTFTAIPAPGAGTPAYQWQLNGSNAGTNSATFTSAAFVNGDVVTCVITSDAPCVTPANATSNSVTMNVDVPPVAKAGGNKTIAIGSSTHLNASATGHITDISWSPSAGLSNIKILQPVASPAITTTYTLMVKTPNGCVAIDSATVNVIPPPVVIPNTFTPNGDGVNDTWNIKNLNLYQASTVQVYNRWGQNVYSSIGYGTPWDGSYKGLPLPAGSYYYVIDLKNGDKLLSGFVAIIR